MHVTHCESDSPLLNVVGYRHARPRRVQSRVHRRAPVAHHPGRSTVHVSSTTTRDLRTNASMPGSVLPLLFAPSPRRNSRKGTEPAEGLFPLVSAPHRRVSAPHRRLAGPSAPRHSLPLRTRRARSTMAGRRPDGKRSPRRPVLRTRQHASSSRRRVHGLRRRTGLPTRRRLSLIHI